MELDRVLQFQLPLMRGDDVRAVQQALVTLDVKPPCGNPDGVFGQQTAATVQAYQALHNQKLVPGENPLDTDGKVGALTWTALLGAANAAGPGTPHLAAATTAVPPDLIDDIPLTRAQVGRLKGWMKENFTTEINTAIAPTPVVDFDLVCAIASKESAIYWIKFVDRLKPTDLLPLCVFDASGDFPGTSRSAFPINAAAMRADPKVGDLTDTLVAEANKMRAALHGWGPEKFLYKGYGLFQYDLQNIRTDEPFFRQKLWYNFADCIDRFMREMRIKIQQHPGDVFDGGAVQAYNGSGPRAVKYARSVKILYEWSKAS